MLTKCLALESLALELEFSPMVLRGLGALQSWSLEISSPDCLVLIKSLSGRMSSLGFLAWFCMYEVCKYRALQGCLRAGCLSRGSYTSCSLHGALSSALPREMLAPLPESPGNMRVAFLDYIFFFSRISITSMFRSFLLCFSIKCIDSCR